jgi:hypothetical protein
MRLPKEKLVFIVDTIPVGTFPGRGLHRHLSRSKPSSSWSAC